MRRALFVLPVALVAAWLIPAVVHAAPGGAMTAVNGTFTGTDGDDTLVIARDAAVLTHNRFDAGDAGFASASDFDSTVGGVQTRTADSDTVNFVGGTGNDTWRFVGDVGGSVGTMNAGAGNDTLDFANLSERAIVGQLNDPAADGAADPTLETILGTAFDDWLVGSSSPTAVGIAIQGGAGDDFLRGTAANDTLHGGTGKNRLDGKAGADNLLVDGPLTAQPSPIIQGGDGADVLVFTATAAADDLVLGPAPHGVRIGAATNSNGFNAETEQAIVLLGAGNDSLFVTPPGLTLIVSGEGGDDEVLVDAQQTTVNKFTQASDFRDFRMADLATGQVHLLAVSDDVESAAVLNETLLAVAPGAGGGPHVRTLRADGAPVADFFAYGAEFHGGVNVALGDLDGDRDDEIVTGPGPGGGPHVRVFRSDGTPVGNGWFAYGSTFTGGVNVATQDVDGDGVKEIITAPQKGGGPHVRIWTIDGELVGEWMADGFGATGIDVSAGYVIGAGHLGGILVSSGGAPSLVRMFDPSGAPSQGYASSAPYPGFGGGASVSNATFTLSPGTDLSPQRSARVTGAGPGGGPHVVLARGSGEGLGGFFAYDQNFRGGVDVATCNADGSADEVVTGPGAGGGPHVRMLRQTGASMPLSFMAYDPKFHGGVRVACGGAETKQY